MAIQKLGDVAVGTIVKLKLNGTAKNFLVVHQGKPSNLYDESCNGTWLLLQNLYSKVEWDGNTNDYQNSNISNWLNNNFFNLLDEDIKNVVKQVKIPFVDGIGGSDVSSGANGLSCKIFLLSAREVGFNYSSLPTDGAKLSYFISGDSTSANQRRIAKLNGSSDRWWTRSTIRYNYDVINIEPDGSYSGIDYYNSYGARPAFVLPQSLFVLDDGTVTTNQPPTAPGSIDVSGVVSGGEATITLTAATDPDGTVESYIYERQVDGGAWQQVAQANSLTQTDQISEDWGTVAYRACAVDDLGVSGPYVTGETQTINSGWVTIGGPAANMGDKPAPFPFVFSCGVSGQASIQGISASVTLDDESIYTGTLDSGVQVSIYIDTRFMAAGQHTITVDASKEDCEPANSSYTFTVPTVTLPYEGKAEMPENSQGQPVWWYGLARFIFGENGKDLNTLLKEAKTAGPKVITGSYQGTGQFNAANPNKIVCGFRPKLVAVIADGAAGLGDTTGILWIGSGTIGTKHVTVDDTSFAWYSTTNANSQLNTSGDTYYYFILG